jgi:hypothetical protein
VEDVLQWFDEQQVVPAVIRLRRKAEAIRHQELEKLFSKLGPLSDGERQAIEAMSSSIINKLLHTPIVRLKQASQAKGGGRYLQALRDLFSLDERWLGATEQKTGFRRQHSPSPGSPGCRNGRSAPRATDSGSKPRHHFLSASGE